MRGINTARVLIGESLKQRDRSAYTVSSYIPEAARDAFLGLRAFNVEVQRVVDGSSDRNAARLRLEFWKSAVQEIHRARMPNEPAEASLGSEPTTILLRHAVQDLEIPLAKRYFLTLVQTQEQRLSRTPLRTIEDMERFGEGTASQLNYALLEALQATVWPETAEYLSQYPEIDSKVTDACAHLGQAAGIAILLRGFVYYARRHNYINLPSTTLAENRVPEQQVLDAAEAGQISSVANLSDTAFAVATRANDHILAARGLSQQIREETGGLPPSLLRVGFASLPTTLYLEQLERSNFDLARPVSTWRLPWRLWRSWRARSF